MSEYTFGQETFFNENSRFYKDVYIYGRLYYDFEKEEQTRFNNINVSGIATFQGNAFFQNDVTIDDSLAVRLLNVSEKLTVGPKGGISKFNADGLSGKVGIGSTNPEQNLDIGGSIKIKNDIFDSSNDDGVIGAYLSKDSNGIRWTTITPSINQGIFVYNEGILLGIASYRGLNFRTGRSNGISVDSVEAFVNPSNVDIADILVTDYWDYNGLNVYRFSNVGINTNNPQYSLEVIGDGRFSTNLDVGGAAIVGASLRVGGATSITGETYIGGQTLVEDSVGITGNLGVVGVGTFNNTLFADKGVYAADLLLGVDLDTNVISTLNGNLVLNSSENETNILTNLTVAGVSTFIEQVTFSTGIIPDTAYGAYLGVNGLPFSEAYIGNIRIAVGNDNTIDTTTGDLNLNSTSGTTIVNDILRVTGDTKIESVTQSIDKDTGALIVEGGVGIEKNLNIGGSANIANFLNVGNSLDVGDNLDVGNNGFFVGIVTAQDFYGNLVGIASTAIDVIGGFADITNLNVSGFSTIGIASANQLFISGVATAPLFYGDLVGTALTAINAFNLLGTATTSINVIGGIASVTQLSVSGVTTLGLTTASQLFVTGIVTASQFYGNLVGIATTSINVIGGIASVTQLSVSGVTTLGLTTASELFVTGIATAQQFYGDLVGTATTSIDVIGGVAYVSELTVSGVSTLTAVESSGINVSGVVTATQFVGNLAGTALTSINVIGGVADVVGLNVSGVSTLTAVSATGINVSGVVTATNFVGNLAGTALTSVNVVGGIASVTSLSVTGVSTQNIINATSLSLTGVATATQFVGRLVGIASTSIDVIGGIASVTQLSVTGPSTVNTVEAVQVDATGLIIAGELESRNNVQAEAYFGDGVNLVGIVTQLVPGIGIDITGSQNPGKGVVKVDAYRPVGKTIYVSQTGNDNNTGLAENYPKRTIKAAAAVAQFADTIKVFPGTYVEDNPIVLKRTVSIEGTELRNCVLTPRFPDRDFFYVNNGCHVTDVSFIGQPMTNGAAIIALQPLSGVSTDRFFDGARMIRLNLDYIARESVGFLTSGFSGFAGSHREQDAARLIDNNLNYIAAEAVGFLTSPVGYGFTLSSGDYTNCKEDIVSVFTAVSNDLKANSNKKSIGAGYSYFNSSGGLIHITGIATQQATIAALDYAAGIATHVINNLTPLISYQPGIGSITQFKNPSVIQVAGGCVGVGTTVKQLVGIVTNMIGAASTSVAPDVRFGVTLESKDCSDDVKDVWKAVIFDITRGGNSKCVGAAKSYFDDNWNLIPQILKNPGEVEQTIATFDYSFNVARAVINNCTWGGYPVGLGTTVVDATYDFATGITTITAINHGLSVNNPVKIENLLFHCPENSPGIAVGVVTATYNEINGVARIQTLEPLPITSGNRVKLENLVFECNSGGGPSTAYFPSGNYRYDFTVLDVVDSTTFTVNVGTSTLPHTYITGGTAARVYTPKFGISTASYDAATGITTIVTVGLGTNTDPGMYIEPGKKVRIENLVWVCDSGGGPSTAYFPSGNNGYDFQVIATNDNRYIDAANLIQANKIEIMDKSLAAIAIAHSDFYFPNDVQTTRFSRFRDAYRLIQQNKTEIVNSAWNATVTNYPPIAATENKCKRDLGYFVDALSIDLFTGGNSYTIEFIKQYFNATTGNLISNGLQGEVTESNFAFAQARELMKQALTNQLTIKDLTITPDPLTNSNVNPSSCANVQAALNTLTEIVTNTLFFGTATYLNGITVNRGIFVAGENKCRRDIGYIVDALVKDLKFGTNKHIREAARAYFDANGSPISNGLVGEEAESITAFNAVRDYAKLAINNLLNKKDLSITPDPATGFNTDPASCADVRSNIDNLIGILTNTITNGNLSSFPTLYTSNKVKINVGVSSIAHTYVTGGELIANYTTNIFPDGTFGYVFPVRSVVGPNTFSFVGGKTVIPHAYLSGGTVQKYENFQKEFFQIKDLAMQPDPFTGFNNAINSCQDVTSALRSCVGVVTTIVGLGSEAGITTSYPGNRGAGFERVAGVSTAYYDNTSGRTQVFCPNFYVKKGDVVEIRDLIFSCSSNGITTSTQAFPSGANGYEFYVEKLYPDGSFDIYVGVSTIPHIYEYGGYVVNRSFDVFNAQYDHITGLTTITAPGIRVRKGDFMTLYNLEFACSSGAGTTTIYPTGNEGYTFEVLKTPGIDEFTVRVGPSTIPHTYVAGGVVYPPFSKGVGPITQGPYIRNATNFIADSIGMKVDGFNAEPGDQTDIGVTGTMSVDSYTQYNQGGIGVSITNGAYSQLVSIFTICDDIAIYTSSGGQCDITNSNASFGNYGLYSNGVGDSTTKSIFRYTGEIAEEAELEQDTIVVTGIGSQRPYDGQALYFGDLYYSVSSIKLGDGGSGYTTPPNVILSAPEGPNGITAEAVSNIDENGRVTSIDVISTGNQYLNPPIITFSGGGGVGAAATAIMNPIYYTIESATLPSAGISTIVLNTNLNNTLGAGTTVYFSRLSLQIATSISLEWVGAGTNIFTAKPALGGVTIQENEVTKVNGGQVVYTSTNQAGNFQIGDDIVINQLTGTISGRAFSQSLLNTVTPLILGLSR